MHHAFHHRCSGSFRPGLARVLAAQLEDIARVLALAGRGGEALALGRIPPGRGALTGRIPEGRRLDSKAAGGGEEGRILEDGPLNAEELVIDGVPVVCLDGARLGQAVPALEGQNSLYTEVRKLIAVRKEHQALQNTAPMEFVYVKESAYPLVYKRTGKDETIYIVLNPSGQDVECDAQIPQHAQSVYSNNGEAAYADGKWKVPAASATFLKVEN